MNRQEDTIVAVATPSGRGGVAIVRVSGVLALQIALQITQKNHVSPRVAQYASFYTPTNDVIDQGLLLYFQSPHSFTGEDVVEIHGHGSPIIVQQLIQLSVHYGARLANPGEFSERAFLNNKIDLTQAEAIADLIQASSETAARLAMRSLQGEFSKKIHDLDERVINLRLHVEAAIDFPEEEIDFLSDGSVAKKLQQIIDELTLILNSANQGSIIREGLTVVIAGRPNAGKSTLINALSGREVAIVTDIAGTTRDVMRESILLDDIPLHVVDTAGLRQSNDPIEQEGIRRAWQEVRGADCVLMVMDANESEQPTELETEIRLQLPANVHVIHIVNKIDTQGLLPATEASRVYLSAKTGEGLDLLKQKIKDAVGYQSLGGQFLARKRHILSLKKAYDLLTTGQDQLLIHRAGELLADDLLRAHHALGEITGTFTSDDLLGKIFSSFCIGK
jgi:tRNA modification GTPase